jgi:hypothetical protein
VAAHLGWLLILVGLASGWGESHVWVFYTVALLLCGAALAAVAYRFRRFPLFAFGVVAGYAALSRLIAEGIDELLFGCMWFFLSALLLLVGLIAAHRRLKEPL